MYSDSHRRQSRPSNRALHFGRALDCVVRARERGGETVAASRETNPSWAADRVSQIAS